MSVPASFSLAALAAIAPVDAGALQALATVSSPRQFASGAFLLEAGQRAEWCYLLSAGLVREFYVDVHGAEHIRTFVREGQLTGSLYDLVSGQPAITWIEALEPSSALAFRYADFERLCRRHPNLQQLARRVAELLYMRKVRREHDMLALTAAERLARWLDEEPELDARITRRHLAIYLGITPEHLSRLLRRVRPGRSGRTAGRRPIQSE